MDLGDKNETFALLEEDEYFTKQYSETWHSQGKQHMIGTIRENLISLLFGTLIVTLFLSNYLWFCYTFSNESKNPGDYYLTAPDGQKLARERSVVYQYDDENFISNDLTVSNKYWATLFPKGDGTVALNKSQVAAMGLPPSTQKEDDPELSVYLIAQFHQLHCLSQVRWVMQSYYFNSTFELMQGSWDHTRHCLDIIRQRLICAADETLMAKVGDAAPGVGQSRTCKNFEALKEWAAQHNAN
ncbi:hypothetical protein N431DRAFT_446621 [Stipitochalara longipes BDJ]|nr:hypothetical protein N431DRAFT_446621 [Stipitochalara longipes BDJ]